MASKQQRLIYDEIQRLTTHPTADEIYELVRRKMPHISLGTVYRVLNKLADEGKLLKLGKAGQQKRFDPCTVSHYHFNCNICGKIYDLPHDKVEQIEAIVESVQTHQIDGYNLEFYGTCHNCKEQKNDTTK
jgi:Fur family ferric uptake transcriptional regulator